ncbi:hypothetical protein [Pyrobaculum ferrireducens]|uniref:hypothetical protein n=1 Tax=Pyrobaculum ferrireducens TaxID=1104324 RepID=UPI001872BEAF|nr:hypothetical protein [Pyrobaculum ferrireducens]
MGKRDGYYDRVDMHIRGHSSAAKRGLRADVFVVVAYTRRRRVAEMWESWLYEVFKPPFNKRRSSAEPRKPSLLSRARRRDKPVEEPVSMTQYAKLVGASPAGVSTRLAETIGGCLENGSNPEAYVDRPLPDQRARRVDCQFHIKR